MSEKIKLDTVSLDNGETLAYRKAGEGKKTLLLIHGNASSSRSWDLLMENMPGDYTTYAVDLRGFGASTYNKPINSIKDFSEDVKLFADKLGLKKVVLMGWSAGGGTAMQFAVDHTKYVEKLILLNSLGVKGFALPKRNMLGKPRPGEYYKTRDEIEQFSRVYVRSLEKKRRWMLGLIMKKMIFNVKKPPPERLNNYIEDMLLQRNYVDINYALVQFNNSHDASPVREGSGEVDKITMPVLVLQGDKDKMISMESSGDTAIAIGKNARLQILENCGHWPLVDDLAQLLKAVTAFVEE